jgi:hypothetical protein
MTNTNKLVTKLHIEELNLEYGYSLECFVYLYNCSNIVHYVPQKTDSDQNTVVICITPQVIALFPEIDCRFE